MTSRRLNADQETLLETVLGPGVTLVNMDDVEDGDIISLDGHEWTVTKNGNRYRYREDNVIELWWT